MFRIQNIEHFNLSTKDPKKEEITNATLSCNVCEKICSIAIDFVRGRARERIIFNSCPTDTSDPSTYGSYLQNASRTGTCLDLQPINGVSRPRFIKSLLRQSHVEDLQSQIKYLQTVGDLKATKVFVLDIKDAKGLYESENDIEGSEREFLNFASGPTPKEKSPRQEIHDIFAANQVDYVFLEGRLKNRIITKIVTKDQADFLQKTPRGKEVLCMMSELVMNLFKGGLDVQGPISEGGGDVHNYTLAAENFIAPLRSIEPSTAETINNISQLTLYPRHYKTLYGTDEQYCRALSNIAHITHTHDESTGTTAIYIKNKISN